MAPTDRRILYIYIINIIDWPRYEVYERLRYARVKHKELRSQGVIEKTVEDRGQRTDLDLFKIRYLDAC